MREQTVEVKPGQILDGRFLVDSVIGKGGQGQVYKIRHLGWNRDFALKLPLPKVVKAERERELYLKEAEAWIRLGVHPNIVRCWFVRPLGVLPGLFLDLMTGGSLGSKMESDAVVPGQWDRILKILLQILEGLVHAHSKGMVHRDLKPENLMIAGDGRVCLTDFGLVKTLSNPDLTEGLEGPLPANASVTAGAMGTPRYGAPEQWLNSKSVSPATDLYSLGCIMFELLCGQRPFDPPGQRISTLNIIERHIAQEPPDPLSIRDDIPPQMAELCLQLLAKMPKQRPQSAEEVLTLLSELLNSRGNGSYQRPSPIPGGDHPDLLNNAAASLSSLGKTRKARELLLKGLMQEAGHPQCLYNLVQLDRQEGKIGREEAVRRLSRARAQFGLALLYIGEGQGKQAAELLSQIPVEEKSGYIHRLEGDALMYAGDFGSAYDSYGKAAHHMPGDLTTRFRQGLAEKKLVRSGGRVYFPPARSFYRGASHRPSVKFALSPDAEMLLAMDESEILGLCIQEDGQSKQAKRELYAGPVLWSDASGTVLLIQERGAFEIWSLSRFQMVSRMDGRVMARDSKLQKLLVLTKDGVFLMDQAQQQATQLAFPPGYEVAKTLAAFTYDESGLGFLTPDGRLASLKPPGKVVPLHWPDSVEDPGGVVHLCLGQEFAVVAHRSGFVRCYCLNEHVVSAEIDLGFLPSSLECDESGTFVVASSPKAHAVLDKHGRIHIGGTGPCALDETKKRCLLWGGSTLRLYDLNPTVHLRTWKEEISQPRLLQFSRDGRRALSMDEQGEYRVWEVDEESRVFERNMLMTPGQTYPEIISSFGQYREEYWQARKLFEEKKFFESYETLMRAREVTGFHQAEEALELQWALCHELQRDGLEAIWERLFISDTVSGQLSADSDHLLLAQHEIVEFFELSGPRIESKLRISPGYRLISAHYLGSETEDGTIIVLGRDGELAYYWASTGEVRYQDKVKTGRIATVQFQPDLALIHNTSGQLFSLELSSAKLSKPIPLKGSRLERAFLLEQGQAVMVTHHDHLMADLKQNTTNRGMPAMVEHIQGQISFCADSENTDLRMVGFTDGTLALTEKKTGRPLFTTNLQQEAISASAINLETGLGVSVSEAGGITFFDLSAGEIMERFIAHAGGVKNLSITQDGRYITTRSANGQFRLWEISWKLSDRRGSQEIPWLPKSTLDKLSSFFRKK